MMTTDDTLTKLEIKSNAYSEALQYRQDRLPIATGEHTTIPIYVVQKITIIRVRKIGKSIIRYITL